uniref:glucuronosyltransferase n=1 Tax=Equus caballus TaxID=9796 RepID=A0A9L0RDB6_HORSE
LVHSQTSKIDSYFLLHVNNGGEAKLVSRRFKEEEESYQVLSWFPLEDYNKEFKIYLYFFIKAALAGRDIFENCLKLLELQGFQCSHLLKRNDIMDSSKKEYFSLIFVEAFDLCSFLVAEKVGKPFVSILPTTCGNMAFGLPTPCLMCQYYQIHSTFGNIIREHFPKGSRPVLSHHLEKAELWFLNSDFPFDFAWPLLPNTGCFRSLMAKPVKAVPQGSKTLNFIAKSGDSDFVLVALGSMVSISQSQELLMEMNVLWLISLGVIWRCKPSHWPKDIKLAANVKTVDWLSQGDLLAHPHIHLFVIRGRVNSIMEAIQHGVPMVRISFFGDQPENQFQVEAKKFGVSIQLKQIKAETLSLKMKQVIEDKRYVALWACGHIG